MTEQRTSGGQHIVIVGNGIAGNSVISAIRRFNSNVDIALISEEEPPLYSPCAFHKYLAGEMEKGKLFLKKPEDYLMEGVRVVFGRKVSEVNVKAQEVCIEDRSIHFDKLVLATGSKAILPPIKGVDKKGVFTLKTISDAEAISNYPSKKVVIVGSGPIGIEVAIALRKKGLEVTVIEVLNRILPRLFDDEPALVLRQIVENYGIKVLTEEKVIEVLGNEAVKGLATDKREIECDTVIMVVGVRPDAELAKQIGLVIGKTGGIETNDFLMTSMENIYACGDCIESKDIVTGERTLSLLWHNAKRQGWVSGCNCVGKQNKFTGSVDATNIEVLGTYVSSIGRSSACFGSRKDYEVVEKTCGSSYYRLIIVNNRLVGMQLINKSEHAGMLFSKMLRKDDLVELKKVVQNDKLLRMKPWHYWISQYIV